MRKTLNSFGGASSAMGRGREGGSRTERPRDGEVGKELKESRAGLFLERGGTSRGTTHVIAGRVITRDDRTARRGVRLQRFTAGWAAFGITLSGATQLRMAGLPVGPSELILIAWISFVGFLLLRGLAVARSRVVLIVGGFWLSSLTLLGFGALIAVHTRRGDSEAAIHDGMAFVYIATLTTFLALRLFEDDYRYHWHFARTSFLLHALAASMLLGLAFAVGALGPVDFWYSGVRFRGWSENPNQMALTMCAMPFLGWWLLRGSSSLIGKAGYALGIAACVFAGIATQSDALRLAWAASFGALSGVLFFRATVRGRSRWFHISHVAIPAVVVVVGVFYGNTVVDYITRVAEGIYVEQDQGEKRFTLWWHGIEAIGASPLFGLGPGPFSGNSGPFEGREAHNTFIDWGMSTGITGVLLYVALSGCILWRALRSRDLMLVGMGISVITYSTFGYMLRHPGFWMVLLLILILSERAIALRERHTGKLLLKPAAHDCRRISPSASPSRAGEL